MLHFVDEKYNLGYYLHQENDKKHTARINKIILKD